MKKDTGNLRNLVELYDLKNDPTEKTDVSDSYPKIINIMLTKLADYYVS
jgi:hypothetical protein